MFKPACSGLESTIFGFPNLTEREAGALLIRPQYRDMYREDKPDNTEIITGRMKIENIVFIAGFEPTPLARYPNPGPPAREVSQLTL